MHKTVQIFLRLKLPYSRNGVGILKIGILASHARVGQASLAKANPRFKLVGPMEKTNPYLRRRLIGLSRNFPNIFLSFLVNFCGDYSSQCCINCHFLSVF